jgi:diguanylate cyclase (GGDEF)-like protein/PAS domain S-box-containing protein
MQDRKEKEGELTQRVRELRRQVSELEDPEVRPGMAREVLRDSEEIWRLLIEKIPDIILTVDRDGTILALNRRPTGRPVTETIGLKVYEYAPAEYHEIIDTTLKRVFETGKPDSYELLATGVSGPASAWYVTRVIPVTERGRVVAAVLISVDITDRKKAEEELRQRERHYRKLWDDAPVAYHILDTKGIITDVNRTEAHMLGYEPEEMVGRPVFDFISPEERAEAERWFRTKIAGHRFPKGHDRLYRRKDGSDVHVSIDDVLEYDRSGNVTGIRTTLLDVTERRRTEETIRRLAYYDALTELPNRTLFGMRLATALVHAHRTGEKLVVMLLDLDHFKNVNDSLGHRVGDELLKAVGRRLAGVVRGGDTVARMGGDEFLVVASEIHDQHGAEDIAQRMMEAVRRPIVCSGHTLDITASIGIAMYPRDGTENGVLVKNADIAMYRAKSAGRNNYKVFTL